MAIKSVNKYIVTETMYSKQTGIDYDVVGYVKRVRKWCSLHS